MDANEQHAAQRDRVARSLLLADTRADRRDAPRRPVVMPAPAGTDLTGFAPLCPLSFGVTEGIWGETG